MLVDRGGKGAEENKLYHREAAQEGWKELQETDQGKLQFVEKEKETSKYI